MKKTLNISIAAASLALLCPSIATAGFFDDLKKGIEIIQPKKAPPADESQPKQAPQKSNGLVNMLGGALGVKQKDLTLINKSLGVIQALQPIALKEEKALGEGVALQAFARFGGEYKNDKLKTYVNLVGKTIAEVSDRPNLDFHFAVLNSTEQNAFAAPGGYIFVTIGLLRKLKNESELAGVLAHEIAHITRKHMLETLRRGTLLSNVSELTLTAMDKDPAMFSNVIDEISDKLFTQGLDKDKEFEADAYGLKYAYQAGYQPEGLDHFLHTLKGEEGHARSAFFSTHPSTGERISKLEAIQGQYQDGNDFPVLTNRFKSYMKGA